MPMKLISDEARFDRLIRKEESGCWEWLRTRDKDGYGRFIIGSRTDRSRQNVSAARWAYERFIGPISSGLEIDHKCRNRGCVNPDHLEAVTHLENNRRGQRATATHCKYGHEYTGWNLMIRHQQGTRECRACTMKRNGEFGRRTKWAAQRAYKQCLRSKELQ